MHLLPRRFRRTGRLLPGWSTLFHCSPSGYVVVTGSGTIVETNAAFAAWAGLKRRALTGTAFADLLSPEDLLEYQRWKDALASGPASNLIVDFTGAGNTRLPAYISAARITSRGRALDLITVFPVPGMRRYERDLIDALHQAETAESARGAADLRARQRESMLKTVLDTVDVAVLVVDGEGREVLVNAHMETTRALMGGGGDLASWESWPVYGPDRVTPVPEEMLPIRRAVSGESFSQQLIWVGAGQEQMAVSVCARPVRNGGDFKGSVLAFSDVTQLVRALAAQGEFMGNVSHELRTPLTSILGYLDMALEEEEQLPNAVESALQAAVRNAERLLQLVSDLLSVASGSGKMELREVDLASAVAAAVDSFRPRARINGLEFDLEVPADLRAVADAGQIRQVLENLVSNAVKYSPGGGTVQIRARRQDESVVIEVADTGIGMTPEEQEQVFNRFFRSGHVLSAAIPGAGLGLVITRRIVEEHGGSIEFSSEAGRGTAFIVKLPVAGPGAGLQSN